MTPYAFKFLPDGTTELLIGVDEVFGPSSREGRVFVANDGYGSKEWFLNDKRHRENGPAVEHADGTKEWFLNGKRHREDGPAVKYADGTKEWFLNGKLHCEDGPAYEGADGSKQWYLDGNEMIEKEHAKEMGKRNVDLSR